MDLNTWIIVISLLILVGAAVIAFVRYTADKQVDSLDSHNDENWKYVSLSDVQKAEIEAKANEAKKAIDEAKQVVVAIKASATQAPKSPKLPKQPKAPKT